MAPLIEAIEILECCGFEEDGEIFEIKASVADGWLASEAIKYIDVILNSL